MAPESYSATLSELRTSLAPLITFLTQSRWAQHQGDPDACDFVAGNPHDMPLDSYTEVLQRWAVPQNKDWFAYKLNELPACEAIAKGLAERRGIPFEPEDVFLTPGTFGGLSVALRAIIDPGDEVVFVSPPWFFYEPMIRVAGATPVRVMSTPPEFDLDVDAIAAALTSRTRAVIVNTPNNPTGRIYSPETLEALAGALSSAAERFGRRIFLLSDESYSRILFDDNECATPAASYSDTIVMYTYGKTLLAPGQRLGYLALPPTMADRAELRETMVLSQITGGWQFPNAVLQYAVPDLEGLSIDIPRLQSRRDRLVEALREAGYELHVPASTFYLIPRSPLEDDGAFTELLAERDVYVLPGYAFELPGYVRLSVTANDEMIDRALPVFAAAIKEVGR